MQKGNFSESKLTALGYTSTLLIDRAVEIYLRDIRYTNDLGQQLNANRDLTYHFKPPNSIGPAFVCNLFLKRGVSILQCWINLRK